MFWPLQWKKIKKALNPSKFLNSMEGWMFIALSFGAILASVASLIIMEIERGRQSQPLITQNIVENVALIVKLKEDPSVSVQTVDKVSSMLELTINEQAAEKLKGSSFDNDLSGALSEALGGARNVSAFIKKSKDCPNSTPTQMCRVVFVTLNTGKVIHLTFPVKKEESSQSLTSFLPGLVILITSVALLSLVVARVASKPLKKLAQVATTFSVDNVENLNEDDGPTEVREASIAFNAMKARIKGHIQEKTYMLAAIAHDIQTPLTRLRLRLEKVKDEELHSKLVKDLNAAQQLIQEGLDLANSLNAEESMDILEIKTLLNEICAGFKETGSSLSLKVTEDCKVLANKTSLTRCFSNIISNALKYGNSVSILQYVENGFINVCFIDRGTGIPEDQLLNVFKPFNRLEESRSRSTGGTGLGLTIAKNIIENHGGTIQLRNSKKKGEGLEVQIRLPMLNDSYWELR